MVQLYLHHHDIQQSWGTLYHYHGSDVLVLEFETKSYGLFIVDNVLKNRRRQ